MFLQRFLRSKSDQNSTYKNWTCRIKFHSINGRKIYCHWTLAVICVMLIRVDGRHQYINFPNITRYSCLHLYAKNDGERFVKQPFRQGDITFVYNAYTANCLNRGRNSRTDVRLAPRQFCSTAFDRSPSNTRDSPGDN